MAAFPTQISVDLNEHYQQLINRRLDKFFSAEENKIAPLLVALESIFGGTSSQTIPESLAKRVSKIRKLVENPSEFVTRKENESAFKEIAVRMVTNRIEELKSLRDAGKSIYLKEDLSSDVIMTEFPSLADQGCAWDFRTFERDLNRILFFAQGNPVKQIQALENLANQNISDAIFALGNIYEAGRPPIQKDPKRAFELFYKAAKQAHPGAQYRLGCFYGDGIVVNEDQKTALALYQIAAANGFPPAQLTLGLMYLDGNGISADPAKAFFWFNKAVDSGDNRALLSLGMCYENGEGVTQDPQKALDLYKRAVEAKVPKAKMKVALCYYNGVEGEPNFKKAARWFRSAAHEGDFRGRYYLGVCYSNGEGVEKNHEKAFRCFKLAAEAGESCAYVDLGKCYQDEIGVEKNLQEAKKWFERSAKKGSKHGQFALAEYLGEVLEELSLQRESLTEKLKKLKIELETSQNDLEAMSNLGNEIAKTQEELDRCEGTGKQNTDKIKELLKLAAEQGLQDAFEALIEIEDAYKELEAEEGPGTSQQ